MGLLTNQYVSESYQGLLNLANANTGLTTTLQTVTDGLGGTSPLQISQTQVNISGSFTINGSPVTATDTGSLMKTGSVAGSVLTFTKGDGSTFNLSVTSSIPSGTISGSQQIIDLGFLQTSSFNSYTSSNDSKVNSLIASTGSYATTSSLTSLSQSIATTDLAQNNRLTSIEGVTGSFASTSSLNSYTLTSSFNSYTSSNDSKVNSLISKTGSYATTGSNNFVGQQNINGSVNVTGSLNVTGTVTATSASFTYVTTTYETASVIYSSGSNQFGDASNDTQTLWGTVNLPSGPLVVTGSVTSTGGFTGSLQGTASYATNALSSSHSVNSDTSISSSFAQTASFASNGGVTQLLAGPNITLSPISGKGQVTISSTGASTGSFNTATGSYGSFYDTTTQINLVANTPNSMSFNETAITNGVSISGSISPFNTYIKTENAGVYNIQFSAQVDKTDGGADNIDIWIRKNGIDLLDTATVLTLPTNNSKVVAAWNWFVQSAANDYYQLIWSSADTDMRLLAEVSSSQHPGIPSVIATANRIDQFLSNTGSFNGDFNGSFTGSLQGTASFASNIDKTGLITTGSAAGTQSITGSLILSGSAGPELDVKGDVIITGSVILSGSAGVELDVKGDLINTGSLTVRSGSIYSLSNNTTLNIDSYLTNSLGGQANIIRGWSENPSAGGAGAVQANYTGSLRITGSNNIVTLPQIRATGVGGGEDMQGYISGSGNILSTNLSTIYLNTGSLLFPKTNNNNLGSTANIYMRFTTSSLAGGHPLIQNNTINGGNIDIVSDSGSINVNNNTINGGGITTTQNFLTNARANVSVNTLNAGTVTLNHISSSINYTNNISNSPLTINNHLSSSNITNNTLTFTNNVVFGGSSGTGLGVWVSGSQSSNATRTLGDNLIGGRNAIISSSFVSSSASNLISTLMYGQNLIVSGNHSSTGGSTFLGRFNDATSLHLAHDIVFAVGTGISAANRRTGLYVTSGSLVGVSGSLDVKGNSIVTGSVTATAGFSGSLQGTASFATNALSASFAPSDRNGLITTGSLAGTQTILGTLRISGSSPLQVGTENNVGKINTYGGANWLYRNSSNYNTVIGNVAGVDNGFFGSSEKNMILNGFFTPFSTGSNNVIIQGAGDDFISGSNNIFIGSHTGHAGGFGSILLGSTSYPSGSIFDSKFELGTQADSRIFHKDNGGAPLQIGYNTQVTGSLLVSNGLTVSGSIVATGSVKGNVSTLTIASNTASLDLSKGNFFTLQLVEGTDTRIEPTSIAAGQTVNIKLNTTGSATVSFPASVKQVSGSPYVPTTTTSVDVITLVSFDNTDLYLANVKNLV